MTRMLTKNIFFTVAGTFLLASCGGGGGSTPSPTTPTTPTSNDSLDDIQVSEDFNSFSSIILVKVDGTESIQSSNHAESANAVVEVDTDGSFEVHIANQGTDGDVNFEFDTSGTTRTVTSERTSYSTANMAFSVLRPGVDISIPSSTETINLSYVTFGQWAKTDGTIAANGFESARGYTVFGMPSDTLPTTGSATYDGIVDGFMFQPTVTAGDPDIYSVRGSLAVTANFGTNDMTVNFNNMEFQNNATPATPWVDFTFDGTIAGGAFTGTVSGVPGYTGTLSGDFYGPNAQEIGGTWSVSGPAGEEAAGAFVGEQ